MLFNTTSLFRFLPPQAGSTPPSNNFVDEFGSLNDANYTIYRGNDGGGDLTDAEIERTVFNGRLKTECKQNNSNRLLWFNGSQGLAMGRLVTGDFEAIAFNIGIESSRDSQTPPSTAGNPILFSGPNVHHSTQGTISYAHLVVGHRNGDALNTIEGKNTINGTSVVNDLDNNAAPNCRADIRVVRSGPTLTWYWKLPGGPTWNEYTMPGSQFTLTASVYVNLVTYAQNTTGVPFWGTCDRFEINQ